EGSELTSTNPYEDTEVIEDPLDSSVGYYETDLAGERTHVNDREGSRESLSKFRDYLDKEFYSMLEDWGQEEAVATTGNVVKVKVPLPEEVTQEDIGNIWHIEEEETDKGVGTDHYRDGDVSIRPTVIEEMDSYNEKTRFVYRGDGEGEEAIEALADSLNRFFYNLREKYREEFGRKAPAEEHA
ncbi:MAG: hypothetical protein ABEJ03_06375, partial [Candidatus Nanohaloarchaea archaeon]